MLNETPSPSLRSLTTFPRADILSLAVARSSKTPPALNWSSAFWKMPRSLVAVICPLLYVSSQRLSFGNCVSRFEKSVCVSSSRLPDCFSDRIAFSSAAAFVSVASNAAPRPSAPLFRPFSSHAALKIASSCLMAFCNSSTVPYSASRSLSCLRARTASSNPPVR